MGDWTLFSNHGHVLLYLAGNTEARLRDVASQVGITERAVQKIVRELQEAGYVTVTKHGRCNRYRIHARKPLRHRIESHCTVASLVQLVAGGQAEPAPQAAAAPAARAKAESKPQPESKPKPESTLKPASKPESEPESKPGPKPEPASEAPAEAAGKSPADRPAGDKRTTRKDEDEAGDGLGSRQQGSLF